MRKPGGVMVWRLVCALGVVLGVRLSSRDEGTPICLPESVEVVRPDSVRGVVAHGVKLLRSGRWCGGRCGVSAHSIEFAQIVGEVSPACQGVKYNIYIIGKTNYFNAKTKFTLFLFGGIKIYMYLCSRNDNKTN